MWYHERLDHDAGCRAVHKNWTERAKLCSNKRNWFIYQKQVRKQNKKFRQTEKRCSTPWILSSIKNSEVWHRPLLMPGTLSFSWSLYRAFCPLSLPACAPASIRGQAFAVVGVVHSGRCSSRVSHLVAWKRETYHPSITRPLVMPQYTHTALVQWQVEAL